MPAFLTSTQILNIGGTADVIFGDAAWLSPKSVLKSSNGVSGGNVAAINLENNLYNLNNALNKSVVDQEIKENK
ncbi:spore germination protein [Bacillus sp. FJAT-49736]|uniref:spore germination protein n=1 Tax=Bacillus sp. FJAT-49736 TaxID=2833582 RepID=UPI001BC988FD|nr:spore germination protein [Bacillus sp. FJAT-49736]MBS4172247.1 spore germination protein [Bacillus sp. FJAT-49736]